MIDELTQQITELRAERGRYKADADRLAEALEALVEGIDEYDGFVAIGDMFTARAALAAHEAQS
jgi:uncharacterized coiled-coil DUF342 family protein